MMILTELNSKIMHRFKELNVWNRSVDLAVEIYTLTKNFPSEERFGLTAQMRRCSVSVSSNIAEGAGRNTSGEFIHFLGIAEGSANELLTQAIISFKLGFLKDEGLDKIQLTVEEIKNKIFRLKKSLLQ
jgi:four helix bundle protein